MNGFWENPNTKTWENPKPDENISQFSHMQCHHGNRGVAFMSVHKRNQGCFVAMQVSIVMSIINGKIAESIIPYYIISLQVDIDISMYVFVGFLEKNRDTFSVDLMELVRDCKFKFLHNLFKEEFSVSLYLSDIKSISFYVFFIFLHKKFWSVLLTRICLLLMSSSELC